MLTIDDGCHFLKYKVSVVNNSPRFIFKELTMIEPAWCSSEVNEKAFNLMKNILANLSAVEFSNMNCIFKGKSKDRFTAVDMEETDD